MSQILHILRKAKHPTAERTARLCNAPAPQASTQTVGGSVLDQQLSPGNDFSQMPLYSDEHSTKQLQTTSLSQTPGQQLIARELARATRQGVDSHFSGQNQLQSKLLSPAVSHFSLPVQRQVDEKGEEEEAKRVAELKANYDAAVKAKDWNRAAVLLNGFNDEDILERLTLLKSKPRELRAMRTGIQTAMAGWPRLDRMLGPIAKLLGPRGPSKGSFKPLSQEQLSKKSEKSRKVWKEWLDNRDAKAQDYGAADYEDYMHNMLISGGSVFDTQVPADHPVHPLFLDRLEEASAAARSKIGSESFGIKGFIGQGNRPGNHAWGIAIDIDTSSNPYVVNEAADTNIDPLVAEVYERIAKTLLGHSSILTPSTRGAPTKLSGASYDQVAEESDAMVAYFSVLKTSDSDTSADPTPAKKPKASQPLPPPRKLTSRQFDPSILAQLDKATVQADYDLLLGKKAIDKDTHTSHNIDAAWRAAHNVSGDFPFVGGGPGNDRDPARGFLSIRKEVVESLRQSGLRWGATDFSGSSGDVMHFDDDHRKKDYQEYGAQNPTEKRKKPGSD